MLLGDDVADLAVGRVVGLGDPARFAKDESKRDNTFTLLFHTSGPSGKDRRTSYASPEKLDGEKLERFQTALNEILTDQKPTYSIDKEESAPQESGAAPG